MAADSLVIDEGHRPPQDFVEDAREPLVDLNLTDSNELWLIQLPKNQNPDFDGQEVTLKLHHDGKIGSFESSSGKEYDVVSFSSEGSNPSVFVSSPSGSKIVGKISRRVSLVHFPESDELRERNSKNAGQMYQSSAGISFTKSSNQPTTSTPSSFLRNSRSTHSSKHKSSLIEVGEHSNPSRNQRSSSGRSTTTYGSRHKSSLSEVGEPSKSASKGKGGQRSSSINQSTQDSGRDHSMANSSGISEASQEKPYKRSRK